MNHQQIEKEARELYPEPIVDFSGNYTFGDRQRAAQKGYLAGHNASSLDSQNQIDKLTECLRELVTAEWMVTHDWGGDRNAILDKARTLLTTFTNKKLEDEKEK